MCKTILFSLCLLSSVACISQKENERSKFTPQRIALYYGFGSEENFAFNDEDYTYKTRVIKASLYFPLNQRSYQLGLSLQPQVHFLEHQLLNKFFVQPFETNFEELRAEFTQLKDMRLYALQGEFSVKKEIIRRLEITAFLSFGPAIIDTETERLSKGFTFMENLGFGIHYEFRKKWFLMITPSFNHVSNAELQERNSGYNALNIEFGLGFQL